MKNSDLDQLNDALTRLRRAAQHALSQKNADDKRTAEVEKAAGLVLKKLDKLILDAAPQEEEA